MNKKAFIPISALMGALLLALFAAMTPFVAERNLAHAQATSTTIDYAENGTGPVATLRATDPDEGDMVMWEVTSTGTEDFEISDGGVLTFLSPPNYEAPAGGAGDDSNTYVVTVSASDGKAADGTTDTTFTADATFVVTVKVTDVSEAEKLAWAITGETVLMMQFEVGAVLTATVSGGDISTAKPLSSSSPRVKWYRSSSKTSQRMAIEGATNAEYTVSLDDVGYYLHAEAHYNVGNDLEQSLSLTSDYPVLATRTGNTAPTFAAGAVTRMVNEGAKGMMVGAPVTAMDDGDGVLNYSLGGTDESKFDIDQKTGQITTMVDLDYEASGGDEDQCAAANACAVTVTATDSAGEASAAKDVTITIVNLDDEKPTFTNSATLLSTIMLAENTTTLSDTGNQITYTATDPDGGSIRLDLMGTDAALFELSGTDVLSFRAAPDYENPTDANRDNMYEVTVRASDGTMSAERMVKVTIVNANEAPMFSAGQVMSRDYAENGTGPVATLRATDPDEGDMVMWEVASTGTEDFEISDGGVLTFLSPPNYEAPAGGAGDDSNTYVVTVSASDGKAADGTTDTTFTADATFVVTVKVTDVSEAEKLAWAITGETVLMMQFEVGAVLTATVSGGDISTAKPLDVTGRQWYRSGTAIEGATNAEYTVSLDDVGHRIRVRVDYRVGDGRQEPSLSLTSDYPVLATRTGNTAPTFAAGAVTRMVNEGAKGMMVGAPVTAMDDGDGVLNYSLGGTDESKFDIDQKTGQITTMVDLDYEASGGDEDQCAAANACAVTVTATDSAGEASAAKDVTITIVNLDDEKPTFTNSATLLSTIMLAENTTTLSDTGNQITYTATDPDGDRVNLDLMGTDAALFMLSGTDVLSFRAAPDYENPTDANGDNIYEVTVRASDGTMSAERMVKVTIVNANEALMMITSEAGEGMSLLDRYDSNNDGGIDLDEINDAIDDFFADRLTPDEMNELIDLFFGS